MATDREMNHRWVPLFKADCDRLTEGKLYFFHHVTDDGGEFYTVREYTRHLAYDIYVLFCGEQPVAVPE